ncbi:membrane protein [Candidatus Magnetobacterium bavaricum]|uniref:Membrane protein n=1 Tax=Candidatus Magnetobacterium bavaricum TaxID=29290 RepID=A0A0F3GXB5_9BACT|nr:membrane protein [Candidatus Magnetobacterium bavaricum]
MKAPIIAAWATNMAATHLMISVVCFARADSKSVFVTRLFSATSLMTSAISLAAFSLSSAFFRRSNIFNVSIVVPTVLSPTFYLIFSIFLLYHTPERV